jgi:hypothetical protein
MKILNKFHQEIEKGCYPIDPFPIYLFMVIALLCPVIVNLLK